MYGTVSVMSLHLRRSLPSPPWGLILGLSVGTSRPPLRPVSKGREPPVSGSQIVHFSHKKTGYQSPPWVEGTQRASSSL